MEKCCDVCGAGGYYFPSGSSASEDIGVKWHRLALTGFPLDIWRLSGRGTTTTVCVFPVYSVAVMEKSCDACGDREYYFRSRFSASADVSVLQA
jgi:hypothetical protein